MPCCDEKNAPSKFNRQVTFQSLTLTPTGSGGQQATWTDFLVDQWVSIQPKIVRELNFAQRIEPRIDHTIRMRYVAGITTTMRVVYGSRIFELKAVINDDEGNEFLTMAAAERTGT